MLWTGTTRRLLLAFGSLVLIVGVATWGAMSALSDVHESLHRVERDERGVRAALSLASAVRDQYAHQAHTIILGNDTHLGFYGHAQRRVGELLAEVRRHAEAPEERALADEMERGSAELDRIFRQAIVPAVLRGDHATVEREHARAQGVVSEIQERADRLTGQFEQTIGDFERHASAVEHSARRLTLLLLLGAILFAAAIGLYIARSVARPIAVLEAGAARIASGDLGTRIEIAGPPEFRHLAGQFNAMTAALREHQEKLVESEKLAGIGRLAAGVAHEINNPLGVILGYVRLLRHKAEGELACDLRIVEDESLRCQEIVEGLLDLARLPQLAPAEVNLRELCDEVVQRLRESTAGPAAAVAVEGEAVVDGDPRRLRQVVMNLVKNAVEATGEKGHVTVRVLHGAKSGVAVSDDGPGFPAADRARLFEPFFTTKPTGTGLGLPVSRAIARAHGGDIEPDGAPGGGSRFTLWLPGRSA